MTGLNRFAFFTVPEWIPTLCAPCGRSEVEDDGRWGGRRETKARRVIPETVNRST
ncbi:hypothetical protein [Mesorhizobium amorphae]|uniref:hypothetical protein n=1 Tax=Mesorhizobium amorphae TaxID=71433 RepID=UPI00164283C8|nr:hypothetical protein [Mesorhizobium amorphae]